jgi:DNA (cytosine-5)-methyltransferase 1
VLDAQYFGVPQRRKRVFIVGRRSSDRGIAEILFKSEGLRRNPTQSKQAREETTGIIATGFGETSFAQYAENRVSTLKASGGVMGGGSETFVVHER